MLLIRVTLLACYLKVYKFEKQRDKVPYYLKRLNEDVKPIYVDRRRYFRPQNDATVNKDYFRRFQEARTVEDTNNNDYIKDGGFRRKDQNSSDFRRYVQHETKLFQKRMYHSARSESTMYTSSSEGTKEFKEEWQKRWNELKLDALNPLNNWTLQAHNHQRFAMVAARPWYKPCGDPSQHDVPWGTCTLPYECEGEYRIYRGDTDCGRSSLVCCAVESFRHDMNAAFDVSFADTSMFSTSSAEISKENRGSKENRHRKRVIKRNQIRLIRYRQKRKIKKLIYKILRQIRKQLSRAFRNNTVKRATALTNLKIFVKTLKKKLRKQRKEAMTNKTVDFGLIFDELHTKLDKMINVNNAFLTNATFREMVVNGTSKRLLAPSPRHLALKNKTRRSGIGKEERRRHYGSEISLQYDI